MLSLILFNYKILWWSTVLCIGNKYIVMRFFGWYPIYNAIKKCSIQRLVPRALIDYIAHLVDFSFDSNKKLFFFFCWRSLNLNILWLWFHHFRDHLHTFLFLKSAAVFFTSSWWSQQLKLSLPTHSLCYTSTNALTHLKLKKLWNLNAVAWLYSSRFDHVNKIQAVGHFNASSHIHRYWWEVKTINEKSPQTLRQCTRSVIVNFFFLTWQF